MLADARALQNEKDARRIRASRPIFPVSFQQFGLSPLNNKCFLSFILPFIYFFFFSKIISVTSMNENRSMIVTFPSSLRKSKKKKRKETKKQHNGISTIPILF